MLCAKEMIVEVSRSKGPPKWQLGNNWSLGKARATHYNQPDGCQEMFGYNCSGEEKQFSHLKFIFHSFNNPKLHKAANI